MSSTWPDWLQYIIDRGNSNDTNDVALAAVPSIHEPENRGTDEVNPPQHGDDVDPMTPDPMGLSRDTSRLSAARSHISNPSASSNGDASSAGVYPKSVSTEPSATPGDGNEPIHVIRSERRVVVKPSEDRIVHRKLRGIHLSVSSIVFGLKERCTNTGFKMIAVNATLGTGLYWRGGQILELGGPLSTLLAFLLPGILAWAVMQCITEMLCIWPIPGALSVYVGEFIDPELGIAVGITYW